MNFPEKKRKGGGFGGEGGVGKTERGEVWLLGKKAVIGPGVRKDSGKNGMGKREKTFSRWEKKRRAQATRAIPKG